MALHNELGRWGEEMAALYLEQHGWYIRHRDWRYKHFDIDIVAIDEDMTTLLMVEVKTRSTEAFGSPDKAIDIEKRHNVIAAAQAYINSYHLHHLEVRYDTMSVVGSPITTHTIEHKCNAFGVIDMFLSKEQMRKRAYYKKRPGCWK